MIGKFVVLLILLFSIQAASAGTQITVFDLMEHSDTDFLIYNASGSSIVNLTSNGSTYTLDSGSYVVQVLPASAGYGDDPLSFISVILAGVPVIFGILLILVLAVGLGLIIKKAAEV